MKILLLEYITGGGLRQEPIPPSLAREGGLMRQALARDLLAVAGVELIIFHDERLPVPDAGGPVQITSLPAGQALRPLWQDRLGRCDAAWPIAPESGGILEQLCLDAEAAGVALLTSPAAAVRLAASKSATAGRLAACGLAAVPSVPLTNWEALATAPFVVKPDDGAGCEGAQIVHDPARFQAPADPRGWIAQPLLTGELLSLSALFADGQARLLSVNRQRIAQRGDGFVLQGCQVNALADTDGCWQALAAGVARAMPELWGYAGIDLILTANGPVILEINPRLTTSYAGLRRAILENPAAAVLRLQQTGVLPPPRLVGGCPIDIALERDDGG